LINFEHIFELTEYNNNITTNIEDISIGSLSSVNLIPLIDRWTKVIDYLVYYEEPESLNSFSEEQFELWKYRLISYEDYGDLFATYADTEEIVDYPASVWLGISRPTDLNKVLYGYKYTEYDYHRFIKEFCPKVLYEFFHEKTIQQAQVSLRNLKMGSVFIAGSGSGKTTLMIDILFDLVNKKRDYSFVIIDPHGHLAKSISKVRGIDDRLMIFTLENFAKDQLLYSYNVFDVSLNNEKDIGETIDNIVDAISQLPTNDGHTISAGMNSLLTFSLQFLFNRIEEPTLLDLYNLLGLDKPLLVQAQDYDEYFKDRFIRIEKSSREASKRRVENAIKNVVVKEMLCTRSSFNLSESINSNKILTFDLSNLGSSSAIIAMGKFIIANIKNIVRKRNPDALQNNTFLVIDEAPLFVGSGDNYEDILSQKRKFGLYTILACQYPNQFGSSLETIKYNTAVKIIAGDLKSDFSKISDVPDNFLKAPSNNNKLDLDRYEFLVNVKGESTIKIKSAGLEINEPELFNGDKEYEKILNQNKLNFYKKYLSKTTKNKDFLKILEPIEIGNPISAIPKIPKIEGSKENVLLYELAKYKFLSIDQMLRIGISKFSSGLPTRNLEKSGYIKSVYCQIESELGKSFKVYFLTKKGAKFIDQDSEKTISPNYPTSRVTKISQIDHKLIVIDTQIELSRFELNFIHKDIDNSGIRNVKSTRISWNNNYLEPDLLFAIGKHYYTLEVERLSNSTKSYQKIEQHVEMICAQAYQKQYNFQTEHISLWVFENESTMNSVMEKCKNVETFPVENFRFKLISKSIYDGWVNCKNEKRCLYYE
jgi:hypothetical protein